MSRTNYLDPAVLARLSGLDLRARQIVEGYLSGMHRSPQRGFSVEFAEHREYVAGDDLRYVDWKVYGKRDRYYLKQFEEETNFVAHLLVDVSGSMRYQSRTAPLSKQDYAHCVAAALAYIVIRQQDAVGLVTFQDVIENELRPSSHPAHLKPLVHVLEQSGGGAAPAPLVRGAEHQPADTGGAAWATPLHEMAERIRRRGLVIVLSDFYGDLTGIMTALKHLRHRRHDVSLMQIIDPAEQDFPFDEPTLFRGLEGVAEEMVDPRALRAAYQEEFEQHRRRLESACHELQADYLLLRTDAPLDRALSHYLARRTRRATHV